jgi:glutamate dehydrogenase (NADP+)
MRFCHSFMIELHRHIGADTDIPAGDIGVGAREIAYLFGMYKRLTNRFTGAITGKSIEYGGSLIRPEATGYGTVYFAEHMLRHAGSSLHKRKVAVSGSGNVSTYAVEKSIELGATVICMSDSGGFIHDPDGINTEKLAWIRELKERRRGRIAEYVRKFPHATFHEGASPWSAGLPCDVALPCATQNEISGDDAKRMVKEGVMAVVEGANMPSSTAAVRVFQKAGVLFAPGKAANAGGVAVSGLEQSQNALRMSWPREEVDQKLQDIMRRIHAQCIEHGTVDDKVDYVRGANLAGFMKVARAMLAYGVN